MRKLLLLCLSVVALIGVSESRLFAQGQGRGQGANRSLGALSRAGAASGGGAQASQGLSRALSNNGAGNAGFGHAKNGLQRANTAAARVPDQRVPMNGAGQAMSNQQQILDRRLDQADHLRGISERNGNERLLETADRMEANAQRNFARQTNAAPPAAPPAETETGTAAPGPVPPASTGTAPTAKRGFWFQSR